VKGRTANVLQPRFATADGHCRKDGHPVDLQGQCTLTSVAPAADCRDEMSMKHNAFLHRLAAVVAIACSAYLPASAADPPGAPMQLVPVPQSVEIRSGVLELSGPVRLEADAAAPRATRAMKAALDGLGIATSDGATMRVRMRLGDDAAPGDEGYRLVVADDIQLGARTDAGLLQAVQTLRQLLPATAQPQLSLPRMEILDAPAYPWRGLSLDVAR